jgi:hypothetical protein
MLLTTSELIKNTSEYKKISEVINRMNTTGTLWMGRGHCISMSDIVQTALSQIGIKSRIVECQLLITDNSGSPPNISPVGYDGIINAGEIDTHVVCITETVIPMVIDASIGHRLPADKNVVVDQVVILDKNVFCDVQVDGIRLTYQQKKNPKLPLQHETSIINRIETDKSIFKNLNFLKILIVIALVVSSLNAARGFYDYYQRYYDDDILIGISATEQLIERLDRVEKMLKPVP